MIQKKICMLGAFAVGKTSLVQQYVNSMFSDKYQTTVGVKVDKKELKYFGRDVTLLLWDIQGDDDVQKLRTTYLRGAAGYILVIDGTRQPTLTVAREVQARAAAAIGSDVPFIVMVNKSDLTETWALSEADTAQLAADGWTTFLTSAKTGVNVEAAFLSLTEKMLED